MITNLNWSGVIILAKNSFVRSFDVELNFMTDYRLLFSIDLKKTWYKGKDRNICASMNLDE